MPTSQLQDTIVLRSGRLTDPPLALESDFLGRFDFTCSRSIIDLDLGGIHLRFRVDEPGLAEHILAKYGPFVSKCEPHFVLDVRVMSHVPFETQISSFSTYRTGDVMAGKFRQMAGYVDLGTRTGKAIIGDLNYGQDFENYIRPIMCTVTPRFDAVLFHTSAIGRNGQAYVFFGPSGAGKSTITKLSSHLTVLTDDMVLLRRHEGGVRALTCGLWGGRTREYPTLKLDLPVRGFFPLQKSASNKTVLLNAPDSVMSFVSNIPSVARTVAEQETILEMAKDFARACPFYELHFSKEDPSFWDVIDRGLEKIGAGTA